MCEREQAAEGPEQQHRPAQLRGNCIRMMQVLAGLLKRIFDCGKQQVPLLALLAQVD